jgi:hypothetical protein
VDHKIILKVYVSDTGDKDKNSGMEDEEEDVSSYWMTLTEIKDT